MKNLIRAVAMAFAVLAFVVPNAVFAQPAKPAAAKPAAAKPAAAKVNINVQRWTSMLNSMQVMAQEGTEVKRINPAEKKQIDDFIAKTRQQVATATKDGKLLETEEEQIDGAIADEWVKIATYLSDVQRKAANPIKPPAKK